MSSGLRFPSTLSVTNFLLSRFLFLDLLPLARFHRLHPLQIDYWLGCSLLPSCKRTQILEDTSVCVTQDALPTECQNYVFYRGLLRSSSLKEEQYPLNGSVTLWCSSIETYWPNVEKSGTCWRARMSLQTCVDSTSSFGVRTAYLTLFRCKVNKTARRPFFNNFPIIAWCWKLNFELLYFTRMPSLHIRFYFKWRLVPHCVLWPVTTKGYETLRLWHCLVGGRIW